jgi:hypothetical protein
LADVWTVRGAEDHGGTDRESSGGIMFQTRRRIVRVSAAAAAAAVLVMAAGAAASGRVSPAGSSITDRDNVSVHAHWESPPDTFTVAPPCTLTAFIPKTGLCHGTGSGTAAITGSWRGVSVYDYGWATTPSNLTYFTAVETFTGTITHCGTGTMTFRDAGTVDAAGKLKDDWQVVKGFGSGALAHLTGHGTHRGLFKADFSQTVDIDGHLTCGG